MTISRAAAVNAYCKSCIYCNDPEVSGTWREQVSVCSVLTCPLWPVRPLAGSVPDWIASRDQTRLPPDWLHISHNDCVARLREGRPMVSEGTVEADEGDEIGDDAINDPTPLKTAPSDPLFNL